MKIHLSGLALTTERFARSFWPALTVLFGTISLLMWQAHTALPSPFDLVLYALLIGAFLFFSVKGLRNFSLASQDEAIVRLDADERGSPVGTLVDRQFIGADDAGSQELWELHKERMAIQAAKVDVNVPNVRLSNRDPWAIRLVVLLFFASAISFGRANSDLTLVETLQDLASGGGAVSVSYEAWAEPPVYTAVPSIYLNTLKQGRVLELPQGTELILRSYGTSALEIVSEVALLDEAQKELTEETIFKVTQSGMLALKKGFRTVAEWNIVMIPDLPPTVALTDEISRTIQGAVQIPYTAADDYGITGGAVEITLDLDKVDRRYGLIAEPENTDMIRFELPVPFNADIKDYKETVIEDLAKHPWSGLPVKITLSVVDAAGNTATIEPVYTPMPGKRFFDTLAGALAEQRRDLVWNRSNVDRVSMILKTLTYLPEDGFPSQRAYLMVRSVIRRIGYEDVRPINTEMRDDMAETLWRAALLIEDGDLSDAAERLKRAQERLSEAMENGATDEEIAELMDEMRKATEDYLRELAENAQPQDQQAENQRSQQISPDMLQELMDQIQELMEQGRMDEAQALLNQLQQMLQNMQVTQGDPQEGENGQQGTEGLQDTLRQQQDLADENFRQMQEEFNQNQEGQNQQSQGQKGKGPQDGEHENGQEGGDQENAQEGSASDLAERQEALRKLMEQQMGALGSDESEAGKAARDALEQAEREMGEARDNLEQGLGAEALDNQAGAVEALRQGMRQLNEANRQAQQGQGREGDQNSGVDGPDSRDILGRSRNDGGRGTDPTREGNFSTRELLRSKEILDEIRRRAGERTRPQLELDYLDRLLDRF